MLAFIEIFIKSVNKKNARKKIAKISESRSHGVP